MNYRGGYKIYLDSFPKQWWYNIEQKRDENSIWVAWNPFVQNAKRFGREAWLQNLKAVGVKCEKRIGNRYKVMNASFIAWGTHSFPRKVLLLYELYWQLAACSEDVFP